MQVFLILLALVSGFGQTIIDLFTGILGPLGGLFGVAA